MNTPNNEQLQLFSTSEPHLESSFYDWEIDREGTEKLINESGSSLPKNKVNKLPINDNKNTERCQENQGRNATHTTKVKIRNASTLNQNLSRPEDQTKCDRWFKDKGLIPSGYQLRTSAMPTASFAIALTMGFPSSWFEALTQQYSKNKNTPSQTKPQAESGQDISQEEQLHQHKQPLPFAESSTSTQLLGGEKELLEHEEKCASLGSEVLLGGDEKLLEHERGERSSYAKRYPLGFVRELSIPCIVKQPKQPEVRGVIRKDEGDRFLVEVNGQDISVSKLFVYPDLDNCSSKNTVEPKQKVSDTSVKCFSNTSPPSTKSSSKTRRQRGEGSGHIYYRTVTRNGKSYRQAYYQWRENGKQRTKYISKKLLSRVEEAEARKLPVSEILVLLGGMQKCSSKSSGTSIAPLKEEVMNDSSECSSKAAPPSTKRRKQGEGTGYIECKPIKRSGKEYQQYWYHYEEWEGGGRVMKKSCYIPKRLVARVEKMEVEKAPVAEILKVLKYRSSKK